MSDSLPDPLELARRVADRLGRLDGVVAVALGGSTARGEARPDSDLDLGIYYHPARPPSVAALAELARGFDDRHGSDLVTGLGGWGPWINGGGWLEVEGRRMDWIYRDLEKVQAVFDECRAGRPALHHQPGHPGGFHTHIYLGEVHHGLPLHDPAGELERLKELTVPYPPRLKHALVTSFAWQAGFALETSRKAAGRGDTFQVSGSFFGCAASLIQVLFALNERYFLNEKGALAAVEGFPLRPEGFSRTVSGVLAHPGETPSALVSSLGRLEALTQAVEALRVAS